MREDHDRHETRHPPRDSAVPPLSHADPAAIEERISPSEAWPSAAHRRVAAAKRLGTLKPEPCEWPVVVTLPSEMSSAALDAGALQEERRCGAEPTNAHHDDYTRPLEVRWLCRRHHGLAHRAVKAIAPTPSPLALLAHRKFIEQMEVLDHPVAVIKRIADSSLEVIGVWLPAYLVDELEFREEPA